MGGNGMARIEAEGLALAALASHILGFLPAVATFAATCLAVAWYAINLYESTPVQAWLAKRRTRAIGTKAYEEAVNKLPESVSAEAAVVIGSMASATAINATKGKEED